jgi:hypothetical protein
VALLLFCSSHNPSVPCRPLGPDTLAARRIGTFGFYAPADRVERVRYVVDWGDRASDTSPELRSGDTVELAHAWSDTGSYGVRCLALDGESRRSGWSDALTVTVFNLAPLSPSFLSGPDSLAATEDGEFATATTDPEHDLITYVFDWGDSTTTAAPGYASGDTARMLHAWPDTGRFDVRARARDALGHESGWSPVRTVLILP